MTNRLRYHPAASHDLRNAVQWYDKASAKRGQVFRQAVKQRLSEIRKSPDSFATEDDLRFALVEGFPYFDSVSTFE